MNVALVVALVVVGSVLFHVLSPWWWTPLASNWSTIDDTLNITFWVTGVGFVLVLMFLAYCLHTFGHRKGGRADYEPENQKLELILAAVTTVAVVALLVPGLLVWGKFINPPENAMEVEALGVQWQWSYRFPGADGKLGLVDVQFVDSNNPMGVNPSYVNGSDDVIVTGPDVHLPINKPVKVLLRSLDVLHDFYVPEFRAKMDLVPGLETYFWFTPTRVGEFEVLCAAFCGVGHPQMRSKVIVDSQADFDAWLAKQPTFAQTQRSAASGAVRTAAQ